MLILLPPSEGKTAARRGARPLDLAGLSAPSLTGTRAQVLAALARTSARPDAAQRLGVSHGLLEEVRRNTVLTQAPAADVARVYTGVLFAALDLPGLDARARRRAREHVVVLSGLWGALRPGDRVPAYRCPVGARLDGLGGLAPLWRPLLAAELSPRAGGLVLDCRSGPYAAMWQPEGEQARAHVAVRVLREGRVVSHDAKHTRGLLVHRLLRDDAALPRTPAALATAAARHLEVDLVRQGRGWRLDVAV